MIRVYAFVPSLESLPEIRGVGDVPLATVGADPVAIVSVHANGPDPRSDAVAHGLVVEALTEVAPAVLPVRFGETFADEEALERTVHDRREELRAALERVRGCVEIGVRVAAATPRAPASTGVSGTGYMQARLAALAERDAIVHGLHERLDELSRASVPAERGTFEASYLVERSRVGAVQAAVRAFASEHPELTVLCTGPWAPYSYGAVSP